MTKIRIAYRQVIDASSTGAFERKVFNDSFNEFYLQSQAYSGAGKLKTFYEMVDQNLKANSLHYKVGFSVGLYISELRSIIPGLCDTIGKPLSFEHSEFQILSSDVSDKSKHRIAILYTSHALELLAMVGDYLIVGSSSADSATVSGTTVRLKQNVSIVEWIGEVKRPQAEFLPDLS